MNAKGNNNNNNGNNGHALTTSRGPVKNLTTPTTDTNITTAVNPLKNIESRKETPKTLPLLSIAVKTEMSADDTDNKSQYEESVLTPLTPPENYSTNEEKLQDSLDKEAVTAIPLEEDIEEAIDKLQNNNAPPTQHQQIPLQIRANNNAPLLAIATTPIEAYDLTTTTPPLQSNPTQTPTNVNHQAQLTVGRRARIGKSMARNMVYAGAANLPNAGNNAVSLQHTTTPSITDSPNESVLSNNIANSPQRVISLAHTVAEHDKSNSNMLQNSIATINPMIVNNVTAKQEVEEITVPLLLKAEIKAEKIKLEDEIIDTMLQQHSNIAQNVAILPQKHIISDKNELKIIKAEPVTLSEVLNESKVKIEADCEAIKPIEYKEFEPRQKDCNLMQANQSPNIMKPLGRMRLLPSWQQPTRVGGCDIDLSNTSDDEVHDLCHSPVSGLTSGKRIKILEYNKNQCKKSPPNSYKSLIKQAEPKMYLCLSRKFDKKSRFGKLHAMKANKNSGLNNSIRRRELILTDQQKQRLKMRKKNLKAMEKTKKREAKEQRRAEIKQKRKDTKQVGVKMEKSLRETKHQITQDIEENEEKPQIVNLVLEDEELDNKNHKTQTEESLSNGDALSKSNLLSCKLTKSVDNSPLNTPKPSPKRGKPAKKPIIPLHLVETIDAVARGYFSEPECRSTSMNLTSMPIQKDMSSPITEQPDSRKPLVTKTQKNMKTSSEKRSKSETKKPVNISSVNSMENNPISLETLTRPILNLKTTSQINGQELEEECCNNNELTTEINNDLQEDLHAKSCKIKSVTKESKTKKDKKSKKSSSSAGFISSSKKSKSGKKSKTLTTNETPNNTSHAMETMVEAETSTIDLMQNNNNDCDKQLFTESITSLKAGNLESENLDLEIMESPTTMDVVKDAGERTTPVEALSVSSAATTLQSPLTVMQTTGAQQKLQQQQHSIEISTPNTATVFLQPTLPPVPRVVCHSHHHQHAGKRNRSRSKFGNRKRQKLKHSTVSFELDDTLPAVPRGDVVPKWNNGWTWEGEPFQGAVFLNVSKTYAVGK